MWNVVGEARNFECGAYYGMPSILLPSFISETENNRYLLLELQTMDVIGFMILFRLPTPSFSY